MNMKKQLILLMSGVLILIAAAFFSMGSKVVLGLVLLAAFLFSWFCILLLSGSRSGMRCLCLFLLGVLVFNLVGGVLMHQNGLLTCNPQSRYFMVRHGYSQSMYDGIYFSFDTFTHLGSGELVPANQTSRAVALIIALTGYFALGALVVLLQRVTRKET